MEETHPYSHLTINSTTFERGALLRRCDDLIRSNSSPVWERDIYSFILEWLSNSPTVSLQTSGSTGKPKTIIAPKQALAASAQMTEAFFDLRQGDKALLCLPASYIAGKMMIVRAFVSRLDLILAPPSSNSLLDLKERIKFAPVVPMQLETVFAKEQDSIASLSQIEHLLVGGAGLNPTLRNTIISHEAKCGYSCHLSYGMTETYSHVAMQRISADQQNSFSALQDVSFTTDEHSQLIINAPRLGIENLLTNDVVKLISSTEFELLGRADNVINSGGVKVHPEQIEQKLEPLLTNNRYFIHGLSDPILGETVALFIESGDIDQSSMDKLLAQMREKLNPFEFPKKIYPVSQFQLTTSGKIQRQDTVAREVPRR